MDEWDRKNWDVGIFKKISSITRCNTHTRIGISRDGDHGYYLSTNSWAESNLVEGIIMHVLLMQLVLE